MSSIYINNDKPVSIESEDGFQRFPFAERIASVITHYKSDDSFVIGLYGKWGEGKTTVLNFVESKLKENDGIVVVKFNPWLFSDDNKLLLSFFNTLASALNKSIKNKAEKIGEALLEYGDAIGSVAALAPLGSGVKSWFNTIGKKLSNKPIEHYKDVINKILKDSERKVVVFIDDIDRLTIHEVQIIFKMVKLIGDFNNTIYMLAFDDQLVASALDPIYSQGGYDYLEKVIQLPLRLTKALPLYVVKLK